MSQPPPWTVPFAKVLAALVILPAALTYTHLYYSVHVKNELCLVGPVDVSTTSSKRTKLDSRTLAGSSWYGMYKPVEKKGGKNKRKFQQIHHPIESSIAGTAHWFGSLLRSNWPSVASIATTLSTPTSKLLKRQIHKVQNEGDFTMFFSDTDSAWCLQGRGSSESKVCSEAADAEEGLEVEYHYPPSGLWTKGDPAASVRVSCPGPPTVIIAKETDSLGGKRNPNKEGKPNKNVQQILHRPATTLLLALNVFLAFTYWNRRVNPSAVSKIYSKIVVEHELWRGFTGATAHFEPLHIGFNMMSLHSLGMELEENYGSIPFLFYNASLIVLTTIIMMALVYARMRQTGNVAFGETSTVGYSGVLFAWMVVVSLERESTCPVPFMKDLCFSTYSFFGGTVKFNLSPIVQLLVAQFIMPRVSFIGHLSGIICGFFLHWNAIPLEIACPQVLLPAVFLGHLFLVRKVVPVRTRHSTGNGECEREDEGNFLGMSAFLSNQPSPAEVEEGTTALDPLTQGRRRKEERERIEIGRKYHILIRVRNTMALATMLSLSSIDWMGSLFWSQVISLLFFTFGVQSSAYLWMITHSTSKDSNEVAEVKRRAGMIWRGFLMSNVLLLVSDSMAISSWHVASSYIPAERTLFVSLLSATLFLAVRIMVNVSGLVVGAKLISDMGETGGGIFHHVFGTVLVWAKSSGDYLLMVGANQPAWTAFEGRGTTLGGGRLLASMSEMREV